MQVPALQNQSRFRRSSKKAKTQIFVFKELVDTDKISTAHHRLHYQQQYEICQSTLRNALSKVRFKMV